MNKKIGNYRWRIAALLFFSTTINYIDRYVISLLKPVISDDLGWNDVDYGNIISAFSIAYALGLLITGKLLDKSGTKIGYALAITIWSVAGMLHAAARGLFSFGAARSLLGFSESANFPAAIKSVAEWFPKKERALATSIFNSGTNIGSILAPVIVAFITIHYGWRWAFIITGALGFIWLLFWLPVYKLPEKESKLSKSELEYIKSDISKEPAKTIPWKKLFRYRQTTAICIAKLATDWVWWFYLYWIPDFLNKTQGINIREVILPLIIIYTMASIGGLTGGWMSSNYIKKGKSIDHARKITMFIFAISVLPIVFASASGDLWLVIALISLGTAAHQGWSNNLFTIISDIFPNNTVGSMVGLVGFVGAAGGALAAPVIGAILEYTGSYFLIFAIAASMYPIAWFVIKRMIPKIQEIDFIK